MDYKGHFATPAGRCHPLTILDDHSRFNLLLRACDNQRLFDRAVGPDGGDALLRHARRDPHRQRLALGRLLAGENT